MTILRTLDLIASITFWPLLVAYIWSQYGSHRHVTKWSALGISAHCIIFYLNFSFVERKPFLSSYWLFLAAIYLWSWWKNGGDDDWKKTKARVSAAVKQLGARLVVEPVPASS